MMDDRIKSERECEQLSALMDGELSGDDAARALQWASGDEGVRHWYAYHVVGDVLRSNELAPGSKANPLLQCLRTRLAQEAYPRAQAEQPQETVVQQMPEAANASVFRWKMVAGFASLAAVAAVGWSSLSVVSGSGVGAQLAAAPAAAVATTPASVPGNAPLVVAAGANDGPQVMIRDPRLDELLAAHRQFGATSNLQMPAGFLRNATFEAPSR